MDWWKKLQQGLNEIENEVLGHVVGPQSKISTSDAKDQEPETKDDKVKIKKNKTGGSFGSGTNSGSLGGGIPL